MFCWCEWGISCETADSTRFRRKGELRMRQIICTYRTDEELVSSLGLAFIAINFLNFSLFRPLSFKNGRMDMFHM